MTTTNARAAAMLDVALAGMNDLSSAAGSVQIYTGSAPAAVTDPPTGTLLATCVLVDGSQAAFGPTDTSTLVATGYTSGGKFADDGNASASGTAGYFRFVDHGGSAIAQGTVTGTGGGGDLELSATSITATGRVTLTGFTVTITGVA